MQAHQGHPKERRASTSLYWQLSTLLTAVTWIFCIAFTFVSLLVLRQLTDRTLELENFRLAGELAGQLQPYTRRTIDFEKFYEALGLFRRYSPRLVVLFLDEEGRVQTFDGVEHRAPASFPVATLESAIRDESAEPALRYVAYERETRLPFSVARLEVAGRPGYLLILLRTSNFNVFSALLFENAGLKYGSLVLLAACLAGLGIGITVFLVLTKQFSVILEAVRSYRAGDFSRRIRLRSSNELGELSDAIDEMAEQLTHTLEELQHRDQIRRDLIANVAHDLRSPAAGIMALADVLSLGQPKLSESDLARCVQGIIDSGESLTSMVNQLFELSKLESGETRANKAECRISELMNAAAVRFGALAHRAEVELFCDLPDSVGVVLADRSLLARVFDNLLGNALKFTPKGGTITLSAEAGSTSVTFRVRDTGPGIPKEDLEKIFERFKQGRNSGGLDRGMGLGLAIVSQALKLHDSTIAVESTLGEGSIFSFSLPLLQVASLSPSLGSSSQQKPAT